METQLPNLSYIAHITSVKPEHYGYRDEMTECGFPCTLSNDFVKFENVDERSRLEYTMRAQTLMNPRNAYLILFLGSLNGVSYTELGLALSNIYTDICIIGRTTEKLSGFMTLNKVKHYDDWENFIFRRFPF